MKNEWIALGFVLVFFALAFGWRTVRQRRLTGTSGFHGISGRPGSVEWFGGVLFVVAILLGVLAPVAGLLGWLHTLVAPSTGLTVLASGVALIGLASTLWAQQTMGRSWRIGVDAAEKTELVTRGAFGFARNPIFTFMLVHALGVALILPNVLAIVAWLSLLLAVELQVRFVEEPYLLRVQGEPYRQYAARVGRFLPGLGLLERDRGDAP